LFINVGNKNDLNPARLIGLINEGLDSGNAEIGKIEIMKSFSFFEIESSVESKLITALKGKDFEGVSIIVEPSQEKPKGASYSKGRSPNHRGGRDFKGKEGGNRRRKEGSKGDWKKRNERGNRRSRNNG